MHIGPKLIRAAVLPSALLFIIANASPAPHGDHHHETKPEFNVSVVSSSPHMPPATGHQDSHSHSHSHAAPLLEYNETQVLGGHAPDPLAYISYDLGVRTGVRSGSGPDAFDVLEYHGASHGWLMALHVSCMILGFFIALPMSIALRTAEHWLQPYMHAAYLGSVLLGWVTGTAYGKSTPNLYEGNVHASFGNFIVLFILAISSIEFLSNIVAFFRRFFVFVQSLSENGRSPSFRGFWELVVKSKKEPTTEDYEKLGLVDPDAEELELTAENLARGGSRSRNEVIFEASKWANEQEVEQFPSSPSSSSRGDYTSPISTGKARPQHKHTRTRSQWSTFSNHSDLTLHNNSPTSTHSPSFDEHDEDGSDSPAVTVGKKSWMSRSHTVGVFLRAFIERCLVVVGYAQLVLGSTVYTGICRENYLNGCMAHLIKGSIFFLYGLLTFGRYIGAFSDFGWAWNCLPKLPTNVKGSAKKRPISAEMVESSIIFLYGATNTWMERFGAEPGSPYTAKQIQHISIAVMYFFAGAIGMALEVRSSDDDKEDSKSSQNVDEDARPYRGSFNPFAALAIGITGIAMAAHHQTYLFQVQIHTLWGNLLALYAVFRCFTYIFVWMAPPKTMRPSRPPTEAVASFFLTAGGLTFMSSTEQIGFWAMRSGRDDVMMFLNLIVALTFLCFTWVFGVLSFRKYMINKNSKMSGVSKSVASHGTQASHKFNPV